MFGIGTSEILIILLIALLILGPKEIPKFARTLGSWMRDLERAKEELKRNIEFELDEEEDNSGYEISKPELNKTEEAELNSDEEETPPEEQKTIS